MPAIGLTFFLGIPDVKWHDRQSLAALIRLSPIALAIFFASLLRGSFLNVVECLLDFHAVIVFLWHSPQASGPVTFLGSSLSSCAETAPETLNRNKLTATKAGNTKRLRCRRKIRKKFILLMLPVVRDPALLFPFGDRASLSK